MNRIERWTRQVLEQKARKRGVREPELHSQGDLVRAIVAHDYNVPRGLRNARKFVGTLIGTAAAVLPALARGAEEFAANSGRKHEPNWTARGKRVDGDAPAPAGGGAVEDTKPVRAVGSEDHGALAKDEVSGAGPSSGDRAGELVGRDGAARDERGAASHERASTARDERGAASHEDASRTGDERAEPQSGDAAGPFDPQSRDDRLGSVRERSSASQDDRAATVRRRAVTGRADRATPSQDDRADLRVPQLDFPAFNEVAPEATAAISGALAGLEARVAPTLQRARELHLRWRISEAATKPARDLLGAEGELAIRVISVRADPVQVVCSEVTEHGPIDLAGEWTLLLASADTHCVSAIGLRSGQRFVSIVHERTRTPND